MAKADYNDEELQALRDEGFDMDPEDSEVAGVLDDYGDELDDTLEDDEEEEEWVEITDERTESLAALVFEKKQLEVDLADVTSVFFMPVDRPHFQIRVHYKDDEGNERKANYRASAALLEKFEIELD